MQLPDEAAHKTQKQQYFIYSSQCHEFLRKSVSTSLSVFCIQHTLDLKIGSTFKMITPILISDDTLTDIWALSSPVLNMLLCVISITL